MKDIPVMANQMLSVGRTIWDWAIPLDLAKTNPFDRVGLRHSRPRACAVAVMDYRARPCARVAGPGSDDTARGDDLPAR